MEQNPKEKNDDSDHSSSMASFDPSEITRSVESLVLSKYGVQCHRTLGRSSTRRLHREASSSSSDSSVDVGNSHTNKYQQQTPVHNLWPPSQVEKIKISQINKLYRQETSRHIAPSKVSASVGTEDLADLVSYRPPSTNLDELTVWPVDLISDSNSYITPTGSGSSQTFSDNGDSTNVVPRQTTGLSDQLLVLKNSKEEIQKGLCQADLHNKSKLLMERLEAERLLLITDIKIAAMLQEQTEPPSSETVFGSGKLQLSNLCLWLNDIKKHDDDEYFMCMIICGTHVLSSEHSRINKTKGVAEFRAKFQLMSLRSGEKIIIRVYYISSKVFKKSAKSYIACIRSDDVDVMDHTSRASIFRLWGETELEVHCFSDKDNTQIIFNSGVLTTNARVQANLKISLMAFLNVSAVTGTHPLWNKQWVILKGRYLEFFNYPPFQVSSKSTQIISLTPKTTVVLPSREECTRKRTLLLKINEKKSIFLSFDSEDEFVNWEKYLACTLAQIKTWERNNY